MPPRVVLLGRHRDYARALIVQELSDGRELIILTFHAAGNQVNAVDMADITSVVSANRRIVPTIQHRQMGYRGARRIDGVILEMSFICAYGPSMSGDTEFPPTSPLLTFSGTPGLIAQIMGVDFGMPPNDYIAWCVLRRVESTERDIVDL